MTPVTPSALLLPRTSPDRVALIVATDGRLHQRVTYGTLNDLVDQLLPPLAGRTAVGDRVLLDQLASAEHVAALLALLRLGATVALWPGPSDGMALAHAAAAIGARLVVAGQPLVRQAAAGSAGSVVTVIDVGQLAADPSRSRPIPSPAVPATAGALILFVPLDHPGDAPGAVLLSPTALAARLATLARMTTWSPDDVFLPADPVSLLQALGAGATCVLHSGAVADWSAANLNRLTSWSGGSQVTVAEASAVVWARLAARCVDARQTLGLRTILTDGPVAPRLVADLAQVAPGATLVARYGSPAAAPIATISGAEILGTAGSTLRGAGIALGRPVDGLVVRLLAADGSPVADGHPGEIVVSGPLVAGPVTAAEATMPPDPGSSPTWCSGDMATRDATGRLWLVGRADAAIRYRDQRLYPLPVETVVESLPFVRQAALVGIAGSGPGASDRSVLAIVADPAVTRADDWMVQIFDQCVAALGTFPVDDVVELEALPVTDPLSLRVDYAALRRRLIDADSPDNVRAWLRERFPVIAAAGITLWYAAAQFCLAAAATSPGLPIRLTWRLPAAWLVVFLIAFHTRVVLDLRDAKADRLTHPGRLLGRGLVTFGGLRRLGLAAVSLEAMIAAAMGEAALSALAAVLLVSWLVYRDFHLAAWMASHNLARQLAALLLVPACALLAFACATDQAPWTAPVPVLLYAWSTYFVGVALAVSGRWRGGPETAPDLEAVAVWRPALVTALALLVAAAINGGVGYLMGLSSWYLLALALLLAPALTAAVAAARSSSPATMARLVAAATLFLFAFDWLLLAALFAEFGVTFGTP